MYCLRDIHFCLSLKVFNQLHVIVNEDQIWLAEKCGMLFCLKYFSDAFSGWDQVKLIDIFHEAALFIVVIKIFVNVCNVLIEDIDVYLVELRPCSFMLLALINKFFQFIELFLLQDTFFTAHDPLAFFNHLILVNIEQIPIESNIFIGQFINFGHHLSFHCAIKVPL